MKKVTITELKKEITKLKTTNKELEERNNRMWELNRKYERELEELKKILALKQENLRLLQEEPNAQEEMTPNILRKHIRGL